MTLSPADRLRIEEIVKPFPQNLDLKHKIERAILAAKNEVEQSLGEAHAENVNAIIERFQEPFKK